MRAVIAGPCVSEFGWELMEWQAYVRKCAEGIPGSNIIICSSPDMEALYADMSPIFIGHKITGSRDCHRVRDTKHCAKAVVEIERILNQREDEFKRRGLTVYRLRSWAKDYQRRHGNDQKFIRYGKQIDSPYKILIHARYCLPVTPFTGDNYPESMWNELIALIKARISDVQIAAIGTKAKALLPASVDDYRGVPLATTMNMIASSKLVIGPSSGPMHLASLCGTPHLVWSTNQKQPAIDNTNYKRYMFEWNPFNTPVEVILHQKGVSPRPATLIDSIVRMWEAHGNR